MPKEYKDLVVGLDIGTAKIMAVVAEVLPNGELRIAGLGVAPSHGLKRGVVVNRTAENVIRLLPPFVITEAELDEGLSRLDQALTDFASNGDPA